MHAADGGNSVTHIAMEDTYRYQNIEHISERSCISYVGLFMLTY